jgi:NADH:ubiquinone oxidoreductase subunit
MKSLLLQIFTWWNGQTPGTRFTLWRDGERVGEDQFGNVYYRSRGGAKYAPLGHERRWVVYNGEADASMIPPGWHGWMHHRSDTPPTKEAYVPRDWEAPHEGNHTGSARAYRPKGSVLRPGAPSAAAGGYQPWTPGG